MSKKLKLLLLGITVVIAGFFIIVLFMGEDDSLYEIYDAKEYYWSEDPENYEFEEKGDVILVKNDNLGFSFEVPSDWEYEIRYDSEDDTGGLVFSSSEYTSKENRPFFPERGCLIGVYTFEEYHEDEDGNRHYEADYIKEEINELIGKKTESENHSVVEVDNYYGYSIRHIDNDFGTNYIRVPTENKIYEINGYFSGEDIKKCQKEFNNLLNSISFTKNED
jgi:hypothetical protein